MTSLAALDAPDPWLVADELLARGATDVARAFAKAAGARPDVEAISRWVEAEVRTPVPPARRRALAGALASLSGARYEEALAAASAMDAGPHDLAGVRSLFVQGKALQELRRFEHSAGAFDESASRATELGWLAGAAAALEQAARSRSRWSEFEGTLRTAQRWKAVETSLRCERGVARASFLEALAIQSLGRTKEAEEIATRALEIARRVDDPEAAGSLLNVLTGIAYTQGRPADGIARATEGLASLERAGGPSSIARFEPDPRLIVQTRATLWMSLASNALMAGDEGKARDALEKGREAAERGGSPIWAARAVEMSGALSAAGGDPLGAIAKYEQALVLVRRGNDRSAEARTLRRLGDARRELGDVDTALRHLDAALAIQRAIGESSEIARTLDARALALEARGDVEPALAAATAALEVAKDLGDPGLSGALELHVGGLEASRHAFGRSIASYERANVLLEQAGQLDEAFQARLAVGAAWARAGDPRKALRVFADAEKAASAAGAASAQARAVLATAALRAEEGDVGTALPYARKAVDLFTVANDESGVAEASRVLAHVLARSQASEAVALLRRALEVHEHGNDRVKASLDRLELARVLAMSGGGAEAVALLEEGAKAADESGDFEAAVRLRWGLALLRKAAGRTADALALASAALALLDGLGFDLADEEGARARAVYAGIADVGASAARTTNDVASLFSFLEAGRARTLLAGLAARDSIRALALPERLRDDEAAARAVEAVATAKARRAAEGTDLATTRAAQRELDAARAGVADVVARIEREGRARAEVAYPRPIAMADAASLVRADTAVVLYGFVDDDVIACVGRPSGWKVVALARRVIVEKACEELLPVEGPDLDPKRLALLRAALADPLSLPVGVRHVVVAPAGPIAVVPPSLLFPDRDVTLVPSVSTAVRMLREKAPRGEGVLALGNPAYGAKGPSIADAPALATRGALRLTPLPATEGEVRAIGDVVLLGRDATERGLAAGLASRPRWRAVHLACHGLFDRDRPSLSALALTPDERDDGFLTTLDVFRLTMPTDLVVLSACETARGGLVAGEGVVGFVRAFLFAGASRVIASLWKVDDDATRALMTKFHDLWSGKDGAPGRSAAQALALAQEFVRSQPRWQDPIYWAAWQLWGVPE